MKFIFAPEGEEEEEEEEEEDIINIDHLEHTQLQQTVSTGRYFVFLMSHSINSKTNSFVGYSVNPIKDVCLLNMKGIVDRNTSMAAPFWCLDIVLGPFTCLEVAMECGRCWVSGTRGKEAKWDKAPSLSSKFNVGLYTYRKTLTHPPIKDLLSRYAHPLFSSIFIEMNNSS